MGSFGPDQATSKLCDTVMVFDSFLERFKKKKIKRHQTINYTACNWSIKNWHRNVDLHVIVYIRLLLLN